MACERDRQAFIELLDGDVVDGPGAGEALGAARSHLASCELCRSAATRTARALALFLDVATWESRETEVVSPGGPVETPSDPAAFTARVMARVRSTPRLPASAAFPGTLSAPMSAGAPGDTEGTSLSTETPRPLAKSTPRPLPAGDSSIPSGAPAAAPSSTIRLLPRRRRIAAVALFTLGGLAAAGIVMFALHSVLSPSARNESAYRSATLVSLQGQALHASSRNDSMAIGGWANPGMTVPSGEILHSLAPSTLRLDLPWRGRLRAGPSTRFALGPVKAPGSAPASEDGPKDAPSVDEIALADGWVSVESTGTWRVRTPSGVVEGTGSAEIASLVPGSAGKDWLAAYGAWATEYQASSSVDGTTPGSGSSPPATSTALRTALFVHSVTGSARVTTGAAASVESLTSGQALEVLGGRILRREDAATALPPWVDAVSVGAPLPAEGDPWAAAASHADLPPLQGVLAALADESLPGRERAILLGHLAEEDPQHGITAAYTVIENPSPALRSAAVRVLAMNASLDRERIRAALRARVTDDDTATSVMASRALRVLRDVDAIPALRRALAAENGAPSLAGRVHAAMALTTLGVTDHLRQVAALAPLVEEDEVLAPTLQYSLTHIFRTLSQEERSALLSDPLPSVRGAAITALWDADIALRYMTDPDSYVRRKALYVYVNGTASPDLGLIQSTVSKDTALSSPFVRSIAARFLRDNSTPPDWILDLAESELHSSRHISSFDIHFLVRLLGVFGRQGSLITLLRSPDAIIRETVVRNSTLDVERIVALLLDESPRVRAAAVEGLLTALRAPNAMDHATDIARSMDQATNDPVVALFSVRALGFIFRETGVENAKNAVVRSATSSLKPARLGAAMALGALAERMPVHDLLQSLLADSDAQVALAATSSVLGLWRNQQWTGADPRTLLSSSETTAAVRIRLAAALLQEGEIDVLAVLLNEIRTANETPLLELLQSAQHFPPDVLASLRSAFGDLAISHASAEVRLHCLLLSDGPDLEPLLLQCSNDSSLWVRAAAMARLVGIGRNEWTAELNERVNLIRSMIAQDSDLARVLSDGRPVRVLLAARMAIDQVLASVHVDLPGSEGLARDISRLAAHSTGARLIKGFNSTLFHVEKLALLKKFSDVPSTQAVRALVEFASDPENVVSAEALTTFNSLISFDPESAPATWFSEHPLGYIHPFEVDLR